MIHDEAEKLARELRPEDFQPPDKLLNYVSVEEMRVLCDHILSGDMRREIANAAFERTAILIENPICGLEAQHQGWRENFGEDCAQPYREEILLRQDLSQTIRSLIQPAAQKDEAK